MDRIEIRSDIDGKRDKKLRLTVEEGDDGVKLTAWNGGSGNTYTLRGLAPFIDEDDGGDQ